MWSKQYQQKYVWSIPIFWKLMLINALTIGIVIWIAGTSVKDFACDLVNQFHLVGQEKKTFFNQTMDYYLLRASLIAIILAGFIHYYFTKKVVAPLQRLTESTRELSKGNYPALLEVDSTDEVGQLTKQFNQLIYRLQQTEQNRNKMLADLAHELRTPLANMNGYLEALSNGVLQGEPQLYTSLHKEALRISTLIDKLYLLHEQEYKQLQNTIEKQRVNMKEVVEGCLQLFAWDFKSQDITYTSDLETGYVYGNPDSLKQVINNLLQNALQYHLAETEISCKGWIKDGQYCLSITGAGQPISEEERDKIFERFYRIDPSRNRHTGGDGLGLSIVQEIVHYHGGDVSLETNGTVHTFRVCLPLIK